jgi:hypothetical protein
MTAQERKILALLTEHIGSFVDSRELSLIALQYTAVVRKLRALGYPIINHVDRVGWKSVRGRYKLLTEREALAAKIGAGEPVTRAAQIEHSQRADAQPSLFSEPLAGMHKDEG